VELKGKPGAPPHTQFYYYYIIQLSHNIGGIRLLVAQDKWCRIICSSHA